MGPSGSRLSSYTLLTKGYEGWIDSMFTFVHKSVLVIT